MKSRGNGIGCIRCGRKMEKVRGPRLVRGKYIVEKVAYDRCAHRGRELIPLGEYGKIRQKISAIGKCARKAPSLAKAMGAVRYFVL